MALELEFLGDVMEDGKLQWYKPQFVHGALRQFADKQVEVTVRLVRKKRSNAQNRWYWGIAISQCILPHIKNSTGEIQTKENIHAFHLSQILEVKSKTHTVLGKTVMIFEYVSTSTMTTIEFNNFKELIQAFWAQRGCVIPDPVGQSFLNEYGRG